MNNIEVKKIIKALHASDGAGVKLKRSFKNIKRKRVQTCCSFKRNPCSLKWIGKK